MKATLEIDGATDANVISAVYDIIKEMTGRVPDEINQKGGKLEISYNVANAHQKQEVESSVRIYVETQKEFALERATK